MDWRLLPTLARFDAVYYGHFKCSVRHVYEYPALWDYTRELYQMEGIAATDAVDEYKSPYYAVIAASILRESCQLDPCSTLRRPTSGG